MNFEIYTDESGLEILKQPQAHNYMAIGGIWIPAEFRQKLKNELTEIKHKFNIRGEMKWKKISPAYLDFYSEIIKYFFDTDFIRSRIVIIGSATANQIPFSSGEAEMGFYKFYYQLLHYWIFDFNAYDIFLDYKLNRSHGRLKELKERLVNSNLNAKILNVQALPSDESLGIQLTDIITGLVAAKFNNEFSGQAKKYLIELTESQQCLGRPITATSKSEEKLNVFVTNLQGGW